MAALATTSLYRSAGDVIATDERPAAEEAATPSGPAYTLIAVDGSMFRFGGQRASGDLTGRAGIRDGLVAVDGTAGAFWVATGAGRILAFGRVPGIGAGRVKLNAPIVGINATPDGTGVWMAAADGGIFTAGSATFHGSAVGVAEQSLTDIEATPTGAGYWVLATDGQVLPFGDASGLGDIQRQEDAPRAVALAATPTGKGYWILTEDGAVHAFGDAAFLGSAIDVARRPAVDIVATAGGDGYWVVAQDGAIYTYGAAPFLGSGPGLDEPPTTPVIGMVAATG